MGIHFHSFIHFYFGVVLGLLCCTRSFSSCGERMLLFGSSAWFSHCSGFSHCGAGALGCVGFSCCGTWAIRGQTQSLWCMYLAALQHVESSKPGMKPVSPALTGRFLTTGLLGKSCLCIFM